VRTGRRKSSGGSRPANEGPATPTGRHSSRLNRTACFMVLGGGDGRGLNAMPTARLRARQCHIFVFVTL
jgi:hypothetical protein